MQDLVKKNNLDWNVDSSGTSSYHSGSHPHQGSIDIAKKHNIDISRQRSQPFSMYDFDEYDLILTMDSSNYQNVMALARSDEDRQKVKMLLNFAYPDQNRNVPDPYYVGGFDIVYDLIYEACEKVLETYN